MAGRNFVGSFFFNPTDSKPHLWFTSGMLAKNQLPNSIILYTHSIIKRF
jgi:hypothetical protein